MIRFEESIWEDAALIHADEETVILLEPVGDSVRISVNNSAIFIPRERAAMNAIIKTLRRYIKD